MKSKNNNEGKFICFEGVDGSGKSEQISRLLRRLQNMNIESIKTREPTDSPFGSLIHQIMIGRIKTDNKVIAPMFVADRLDHLLNDVNGIDNMLRNGTTVISDRYYFSSYAYHGVDMPINQVINANIPCAEIRRPTISIFIDTPPNVALDRIQTNRSTTELFENMERLTKVRENYLKSFELLKEDENFIIIDGDRDVDVIENDIWQHIKDIF